MGYFFICEGRGAMKKLFVVLAAILLLIISGCSGGKDSSSSSSSNTTSATVNSTGGSVQLADGANVTIPAGVVADNTSVTLTQLTQPKLYASQATAVTNTYQITIPAGSTTAQSSGSNNIITFQIPVPTSVSTSVKKVFSHMKAIISNSNANDAYNVSEVTISNGTSTSTLYGHYYVASNGNLSTSIPAIALTSTSGDPTVTVTGINVLSYLPSVVSSLNNVVPSSPPFPSVSGDQTKILSGKTPIILIHGWKSDDTLWENFIEYFNSESVFTGNFKLYTYSYDSTQHIHDSASGLNSAISGCFPSQKVIIIAHSMGGLVAHSYIQEQEFGGSSKVLKLITLGTPYHGSPLIPQLNIPNLLLGGAQYLAVFALGDIFFATDTDGAQDLAWDNYTTSNSNTTTNPFLFGLNSDLTNNPQSAKLYTAFAGSNLDLTDTSHFDDHTILPYPYLMVYGESDGLVPVTSAFNDGHPNGFVQEGPELNYDHQQMITGRTGDDTDPLFPQIGIVLVKLLPSSYNISGIITDSNSKPLSGVTVNLIGGSSSVSKITGINGDYSFNVAYGTYTLTPVLAGYTFNPASTGVTVDGTGANFILSNITATANPVTTYNISGKVTLNGTGLAGVTITLTGSGSTPAITNSSGNYSFSNAANGSYTVTPSLTGYTFSPANATANVSGANYTVPDFVATANPTANGLWTWVSGSNTVNQTGIYGTEGVAAAGNVPGAREDSISWTDKSGNLWLFGGDGYDSAGKFDLLNDLWKYDGANWTWVSGSNIVDQIGSYGTQGVAAAGNVPGARCYSISWTDSSGNLWLFGGYGYYSAGNLGPLNDLWKYDGTNWTWVSGSNTGNQKGTYGTEGVADAGNVPGARCYSISWTDSSGNLWLFGGQGYDSAGNWGVLNDLWKYNGANWTWVSGSNTVNQSGSYGTQGVAAAGNVPGARIGSVSWTDSSGNLWLFGGYGYDSAGNEGFLNDLWKYNGTNWTWVSGSTTGNQSGSYGTQGVAAAGNVPGAREHLVSWIDKSGNLWLFGGIGYDSVGHEGFLNDLWKYNGTNWTWVSGSTTGNQSGTYGTEGVAAAGNVPGARDSSVSWIDKSGNLCLFGGEGYLNDLWRYQP
jgi:N-acetylneuraminic acid mutarotase/pimeloyl-ACP methyl ester carboxylesterase